MSVDTRKGKTVGEAIATYKQEGKEGVSLALRAIINDWIEKNTKTEFENDCYRDALFLTQVMFERAEHTVRIVTGPGFDHFLEALEKPFLDMLNRLAKNEGFVRIVLLSPILPQGMTDLCQKFSKTLAICRAESKEEIKHFIVCDSKMARLEEVHAQITDASLETEIKARVYFNDPVKTEVFASYFDKIWSVVQNFEVNKRVKTAPVDANLHTR